jgi:hypothetical protein
MIWMIVFWSISCIIQYTDANNTRSKENMISMPLLDNMKGILTKQLFIIIYVNVCLKRIYPHKTKNYGKIPESKFSVP